MMNYKVNRFGARGFTMIELLIVIMIIGLLASLVAPKMFSKVDSTERKTAAAQMQMFETALDTYRLDMGRYPKSLDQLVSSNESGWDGPYLPDEVPNDPWGQPYVYQSPGPNGQPYTLKSYGKDRQPGGEENNADIVHK